VRGLYFILPSHEAALEHWQEKLSLVYTMPFSHLVHCFFMEALLSGIVLNNSLSRPGVTNFWETESYFFGTE